MNGDLERHDPLTADARATLEAFNADFGGVFRDIRFAAGRWLPRRRDGTGGELRGLTPDDLAAAMRASRGIW